MISVFRIINKFAGKFKALDSFAIFCAKYLLYILIIFLIVFAFIVRNSHIFFYPLFSGILGTFIIDTIIYLFYKRQRPADFKETKILIPVPKNPSFPSRHSSFMFGVSFYLFLYNIPLAVVFIIGSCLIGLSRVFCGVHWFSDILAGVLVGFISTLAVYNFLMV